MGKQTREVREVQNPALLAVGCRPDVYVWRQQVGVFRAMDNPERIVKVGTAGMSDAGMVVAVKITPDMVGKTIGVAAFPEFKTKKGSQKDDQKNFQRAVESRGAPYRLVRTEKEMVQFVEDVKAGKF